MQIYEKFAKVLQKSIKSWYNITRNCERSCFKMSEEQRMIIDATANMPVNQLREILTYIRYIQYKSMKTDVPERLIVKDEEELENE